MMSFNDQFKNGIVVFGAGNVATHLSIALKKAGLNIKCIYSKTIDSAKKLAIKVDANYTNEIEHIPVEADLYIIAVKDEVIDNILKQIKMKCGIVVHTHQLYANNGAGAGDATRSILSGAAVAWCFTVLEPCFGSNEKSGMDTP